MNEEKDNQSEEPHESWLNLANSDAEPVSSEDNYHQIPVKRQTDQKNYFKSISARIKNGFAAWFFSTLKTLGIFIAIFVISFAVLNFPAIITQTNYFFNHSDATTQTNEKATQFNSKNNNLFIPKISVDTPIHWNVSEDETLTALETGVAHYLNTALPGNPGNVFISGHSSYYWWKEGSYKEVFALLDKLEKGDKIYVSYNKKIYVYAVTDKKVVKPNNLEVLNQTDTKTLSLMTCVPVGTNINRLVVTAKQI